MTNFTIFLDIDGVLNSLDSMRSISLYAESMFANEEKTQQICKEMIKFKYSLNGNGDWHFDERCKRYFNAVCNLLYKKYECAKINIVITSAWGYHGIDKIKKIWEEEQMLGDIVDLSNTYCCERCEAIKKYLKKNSITNNWASLDDDAIAYKNEFSPEDQFRIVIPNSQYGINYDNCNELLNALTDKKCYKTY